MICLKIRTFVVSATTSACSTNRRSRLWFAWKFVPLWYQQQLLALILSVLACCDLLENSYLCGISNNSQRLTDWRVTVVICLKIRTFVVSATTPNQNSSAMTCCDLLENSYLCGISNNNEFTTYFIIMLWFAWKFVPLWYQQQLKLDNLLVSIEL